MINEEDELVSLVTAMRSLGLDDDFLVLPMCNECGQIIPSDSPKSSRCPECASPMFTRKHSLWRHGD